MNPLTKEQEKLRRKDVRDMSIPELQLWISVCNKMENGVKYNKARRSWTKSRGSALDELDKRNAKEQ